tara:strand:- start:54054 stop:54971 length:918 start_codon:yes stop_codon:yes gene_type:complete
MIDQKLIFLILVVLIALIVIGFVISNEPKSKTEEVTIQPYKAALQPIITTVPANQFGGPLPFIYGEVAGVGHTWTISDPHYSFSDRIGDDVTSITVKNVGFVSELDFDGQNLESISFPDLQAVNDLGIYEMDNLTSINFMNLKVVGDSLDIYECLLLTSISLSSLISSDDIDIYDCPLITTISLSKLADVTRIDIYDNDLLESVNFSQLSLVRDSIDVYDNASLTTLSFPNLKKIANNLNFSGNALTEASVDGILDTLAKLDGTNNTTEWINTVDLSGGTNSVPSAAGLASIVIIEGRGGTVATN